MRSSKKKKAESLRHRRVRKHCIIAGSAGAFVLYVLLYLFPALKRQDVPNSFVLTSYAMAWGVVGSMIGACLAAMIIPFVKE